MFNMKLLLVSVTASLVLLRSVDAFTSDGFPIRNEVPGCKYEIFQEYKADATVDDGSCTTLSQRTLKNAIYATPVMATLRHTCDGHTGDLAMLGVLETTCASVAHGYAEPTTDKPYSCEDEDGNDTLHNFGVAGVDLNLKMVCPETCGVPCAHAPTGDVDAIAAAFLPSPAGCADQDPPTCPTCATLKEHGACESPQMFIVWFCGESCRPNGAQYDECIFHESSLKKIEKNCANEENKDLEICKSENPSDYLGPVGEGTSCKASSADNNYNKGKACVTHITCPADSTGVDCNVDDMSEFGSTQVKAAQCAQCGSNVPQCGAVPDDDDGPRKLSRWSAYSGAMMTKGVFSLTASG